ncbi:hypothetical protein O181_034906 [Austropuccinia psidii MF-1]|uniref:Tc1-like transposase DDE domain-containing protein n=1 Tax=Austropuccinia psidii MF-1 TaxID=1389203 RepID=A0A9Q3H8G7_9BASI|nr:hypothetical protein [Austropuccinia psidii MF-1]
MAPYVDVELRAQIVGMRKAGVSIRGSSNATHVAKSTVLGIINQYNQRGHCKNNNKPGQKSILDDNNCAVLDAYLVDHRQATLAELLDTIPKCVAPKKPYLRPVNFARCWEFSHKLHLWNPHQWGHFICTNECSFELGKKSDQVRVWKTPNKKYNLPNLQVNHQSGRHSIMIWACFVGSTKGQLDAAAFIEQVYNPALLPFFNQLANAPYIQGRQNNAMMEDGAPIHTACLSNEWCQENAIAKLPWPAPSLDLNLIENIWRKMKSRVIKHYNPHTIAKFRAAIFGAWNDLPAQFLEELLFKMHD